MIDEPIGGLLTRLSAERADSAWAEFLERFSPLIMHVVRRYETDPGRATDCFIHVCGELSNNGFRRLLRFRPDGTARFQTWLSAVVSNLCVDWRRQAARTLPPDSVGCTASRTRSTGLSLHLCARHATGGVPACPQGKISGPDGATSWRKINGRLFALLTPQAALAAEHAGRPSRYRSTTRPLRIATAAAFQLEEPGPGPDELAQTDQERSMLEAAMARLLPQQRLLLRLRYQQDLTLEEIARLTGLPDPFRANRQIQAALEALAEIVKAQAPSGAKRRDVSV